MKNKLLLSIILLTLLPKATPGLADELISNLGEVWTGPGIGVLRSPGQDIAYGVGIVTGSTAFSVDSVTLEHLSSDTLPNPSFHVLLYRLDSAVDDPRPTMTLLGELGNPTLDSAVTQWPGQTTFVDYSPLTTMLLEPTSHYVLAVATDNDASVPTDLLFTLSNGFEGVPDWLLGNDYFGILIGSDIFWQLDPTIGHLKFRIDGSVPPNLPPDISQAHPSIATVWPPDGKFVRISILGVTDPDNDPITISINGITQDEPVVVPGADSTSPDAIVDGSNMASVRAERLNSGNGRVYRVSFTANDGKANGTASGVVYIQVPHDRGSQAVAIDDGPVTGYFDSTVQFPASKPSRK